MRQVSRPPAGLARTWAPPAPARSGPARYGGIMTAMRLTGPAAAATAVGGVLVPAACGGASATAPWRAQSPLPPRHRSRPGAPRARRPPTRAPPRSRPRRRCSGGPGCSPTPPPSGRFGRPRFSWAARQRAPSPASPGPRGVRRRRLGRARAAITAARPGGGLPARAGGVVRLRPRYMPGSVHVPAVGVRIHRRGRGVRLQQGLQHLRRVVGAWRGMDGCAVRPASGPRRHR